MFDMIANHILLRAHRVHNPTYSINIQNQSNSEQLPQLTSISSNHHCDVEEEAGGIQENVYHILENPADDNDVYEVLDNYEKEEQNQKENVLDGPTVIEEEPEGVAIILSNDITPEDHHEIPMLLTK